MKLSRHRHEALLKNKVTPAVLTAFAISLLTYILYYVNFDLLYGHGASAILFASFGSSAFILFMTPRSKSARLGAFVKSYLLAAALGAAGFYILPYFPAYLIIGAITFLLSMAMYASGSIHPPAVGIAVAFVLYRISSIYGVLVVLLAVILLVLLRSVLERFVYVVEKDIEKDIVEGLEGKMPR